MSFMDVCPVDLKIFFFYFFMSVWIFFKHVDIELDHICVIYLSQCTSAYS